MTKQTNLKELLGEDALHSFVLVVVEDVDVVLGTGPLAPAGLGLHLGLSQVLVLLLLGGARATLLVHRLLLGHDAADVLPDVRKRQVRRLEGRVVEGGEGFVAEKVLHGLVLGWRGPARAKLLALGGLKNKMIG